MKTLRRFLQRALRQGGGDQRMCEEVEEHIAMQTADNVRHGLPLDEARRQAVLKFGPVEAIKEDYRERQSLPFLETFSQNVRYALRGLRQSPAFTSTIIVTLALGIGATTSIFTLAHAVLLKSLPVSSPSQLYRLGKEMHCCVWGGYSQDQEFSIVSYDLYQQLRDHTDGFQELAAFEAGKAALGVRRTQSEGAAESYNGEFVSGNYFAMFGVGASAGRTLRPADDQPDAPPAAMMSYRLWQQKYGLDPSVVGSVFNINDRPFTVVGITPPAFYGDTLRSTPPDFFLPLAAEPLVNGDGSLLRHANTHWLDLIGRVRTGASPASIEAQMRVELKQWLQSHSGDMNPADRLSIARQTLYLTPGGAGMTRMRTQYEQWLRILMMVSGFVLLIVCANVANLMLVRGMERRQQTSLSMALGARPGRLAGQSLTESILLSLLGGVAGVAVAFAGSRLILHFAFPGRRSLPISASPSIPVFLFALGISLMTGIVFGIAPAWMAMRADPMEALRGVSRSTRRSGSLPRKTLVIAQASLSLTLLALSGLLTATLRNLEHMDLGFQQTDRMVVNVDPVLAGYKPEQLPSLYLRLDQSLSRIPGVSSVAFCLYSPLNGDEMRDSVFVEGRSAPPPSQDNSSSIDRVTARYFDTIGNPILRGRPISDEDTASSRHVAVINEAFAAKFFKGEDPIGKHFGRSEIQRSGEYEVIGVAKDARYFTYDLPNPVGAFAFVPESQSSVFTATSSSVFEMRSHFLTDTVIRTRPGAKLTEQEVRRALADTDPNLPLVQMQTMADQVAGNFNQQRLIARLTSLFGMLALVLASIGLYGVTAYSVGARTSEIGLRMALGADRSNVLSLILRSALVLTGVGLAVGVPLSLAASRLLANQLYGIDGSDPIILTGAILVLSSSALAAAVIPAWRASSISPIQALRAE